jgi:hypothetical protein
MTAPAPDPIARSRRFSARRGLLAKIAGLVLLGLILGFAQGWMASRYYGPGRVAGFHLGVIEGAAMPAALPALLLGKDVPIYASNNQGRPYKIGYILGINLCGTLFFGFAFWQRKPARGKCPPPGAPPPPPAQ